MVKAMYERLHLDKEGFDKEKYDKVYEKLNELSIVDKKKYHGIYKKVYDLVVGEFERRGLEEYDLTKLREEANETLVDDKKIVSFFKDRLEVDIDLKLEEVWEERLGDIQQELGGLLEYHLVNLALQVNTIETFIDLLLVKEDEYWRYKSNYTLYLLKESGFEFKKEEENDRVWQPKS